MRDEQVKLLTINKDRLLRLTELQSFAKILQERAIFTETEVRNLFANHDERYNKNMFFQAFIDKEEAAYNSLVSWLTTIGQCELARRLAAEKSGITPFGKPLYENNDEDTEDNDITSSIESEVVSPFDESRTPLSIEVSLATEFLDTRQHNPNIPFYSCRSKKRGKVLIINNHDFQNGRHKPRTGAKVDEDNLAELFKQMGGWIVQRENNLTADEMRCALKKFAKPKREKRCDVCFVFIMSHGEDELNETIIYGTDGHYLSTSAIQDYFTNENCSTFRGKPKVFIYQVCRGPEVDLPKRYSTEFDGRRKHVTTQPAMPDPNMPISQPVLEHFRPVEDMLIGHATMQGSKAHRDPFRGTWYIELICEHFMKLAKDESVVDLLVKVDEGLRRRMSEFGTVQTSEHTSKGFKKLYLNPGIFEENGNLVRLTIRLTFSALSVNRYCAKPNVFFWAHQNFQWPNRMGDVRFSDLSASYYPPTLKAGFMGAHPPMKSGSYQSGHTNYFQSFRNERISRMQMPPQEWGVLTSPYTPHPDISIYGKPSKYLQFPPSGISMLDAARQQEVDDFYRACQMHRDQYKDHTGTLHPLDCFKTSDYSYQCPKDPTSVYLKCPERYTRYKDPVVLPLTLERSYRAPMLPERALTGVYDRTSCK